MVIIKFVVIGIIWERFVYKLKNGGKVGGWLCFIVIFWCMEELDCREDEYFYLIVDGVWYEGLCGIDCDLD